ncbi:hypothetical protein [Desulfitobacterium sp.]|uniref:hypothetical protein n=1 Tax=Desulfitobacterium sp. TaxID=49981 RepID=UPI003A5214A4
MADLFCFWVCFVFPSVYRTASTGDTAAAIRPGFKVLMSTVMTANSAAPMNINGLGDTDTALNEITGENDEQ